MLCKPSTHQLLQTRRLCSRLRSSTHAAAVRPSRRAMATQAVLSNKAIVVTGGSQGIGLEFVRQLLAKDNNVIAAVRNPAKATALQELQQANPPAESPSSRQLHITTLDVAQPSSVEAWAAGLRDACPGLRCVDVCINNAGVYGPRVDLAGVTAEEMMEVYRVNTVGPTLVVQALLKHGLLGGFGGKGLVANMSSKMGSIADNSSGGSYMYRASKAALNIVTKSMALDLSAQGVSCVLLHPGYVRTGMTGGQGLVDASESAAGLISVLEGNAGPLNGCWYSYTGTSIPW